MGATLRARLSGREYQFDDGREIRVGRDPSADMVSANPYVSREHAVVRRAGDSWVLEDRGSRGGTYLGDQRVSGTYEIIRQIHKVGIAERPHRVH